MLGDKFISNDFPDVGVLEDKTVCAVFIDTRPGHWVKMRVGDLSKLPPQRGDFPTGYSLIDTMHHSFRGSQVAIVKRGQSAVLEGKGILRLFVRVPPGTGKHHAQIVAGHAYASRRILPYKKSSMWYDHFVPRGK